MALEFPYAKFLVDGQPILGEKLYDGTTHVAIMLGNMREIGASLIQR